MKNETRNNLAIGFQMRPGLLSHKCVSVLWGVGSSDYFCITNVQDILADLGSECFLKH